MGAGFRVDGYFIPISFDKNNDTKLQVSELSIWCKANDFEYVDNKIVPATQFDIKKDAESKFDKQKYSLEALKQRYPESKYYIRYYEESEGKFSFNAIDKETNEAVFSMKYVDNDVFVENFDENGDSIYCRRYDSTGKMLFYYDEDGKHYPIVDNIYDDIRETTSLGIPTTGKNIVKHVKDINSDNVIEILKEYEKKAGKSIFQDIFSERGLKPEERAMLVRHIKNMLVEKLKSKSVYTDDLNSDLEKGIRYEQNKAGLMSADDIDKDIDALLRRLYMRSGSSITKPNGKIDNDFEQGHTGDCWLLAAIKSISNNPKGLKILNDSVSVNKFGDVTVHLKGVNKTYTIYKEELEGANELASGDGDIRALEIAVNRYFKETNRDAWDPHNRYDIEGNQEDVAYDILLGTGKSIKSQTGLWGAMYDWIFRDHNNSNMIEKAKRGDAIINVSVHGRECRSAKDENDNDVTIYENHAYSVVDADEQYVYLVNPWDSSTRIKMTHEDFKATFNSMRTVDLE